MCENKVMKMNKKEKLDNMLCEKNGVLQTADVIEAGISKTYFMEYVKKMELERVVKGIYLSPDAWEALLELGRVVNLESPEGHLVKAYNAERTVCDLLRSRSNVEIQDLQIAIREYLRSKEKNLPQLMRYAKEFRVEKILRPYLEVLL